MKVEIENWKIQDLFNRKSEINEQPKYQRKDVWKKMKRQLLIDSIIRGIDIPKFYFRKIKNGMYNYEVADGQQRLTSIWKFLDDGFKLSISKFGGMDLKYYGTTKIGGKVFSELDEDIQKKLLNFPITVAVIEDATNDEIRSFFGRLQMGESLVPAEIRNAIISNIGVEIDNIALNHDFFKNTNIKPERYRHQDFISHIFALALYPNIEELKAKQMYDMYIEFKKSVPQTVVKKVVAVLDDLHKIDVHLPNNKRIVNKWSFVDLFWLIYKNKDNILNIDYNLIANEFYHFELDRIQYNTKSQILIEGKIPTQKEKHLFTYITDFKTNASNIASITNRLDSLDFFLSKHIKKR